MWRWLCFATFSIVLVSSFFNIGRVEEEFDWHYVKWFIYLTNWTVLICFLQSGLGALICTKAVITQYDNLPDEMLMTFCRKLYWILYSVATVHAVVVCMAYWVLIYRSGKQKWFVWKWILYLR